jgi:DMSO reductase anchor subunit
LSARIERSEQLIPPRKQQAWRWPAVINFVLGGTGAGFYLLSFLATSLMAGGVHAIDTFRFSLLSPILVCAGLAAVALEAGHPVRSPNLFRHIPSSWLSIEVLAATVFLTAMAADWISPKLGFKTVAAIASMSLIVSHGFVVYRCRAVAAWNMSLTPLVFVTSSFHSASGLLLLVTSSMSAWGTILLIIAMGCGAVNLAIWFLYLWWSKDSVFRHATRTVRRLGSVTAIVGLGHLLPMLVLALLVLEVGLPNSANFRSAAIILSGFAMLFGGATQKVGVIRWAGYLRGISLTTRPSSAKRYS